MRSLHPAAAGLGILLGLSVLSASAAESADAAARGAKTYVEFCQGCHGGNKSGLTQFAGTLEDLQRILDGETNQMPDFYGIFSEAEVAEIYAYLTGPANP